jgi:hydrogenase maturation protein HypF
MTVLLPLWLTCPPLARIDSADCALIAGRPAAGFHHPRERGGSMRTQIVPDAATCPACLAEMNDPRARRYRYPFINCTHCGPRFTIIRAMPYDRPFTAMAPFPLCSPARRNTAILPIAVFTPSRWPAPTAGRGWSGGQRETLDGEAALQAAIARLAAGDIVAIKGSAAFIWPATPVTPLPLPRCGRANTVRRNRWR